MPPNDPNLGYAYQLPLVGWGSRIRLGLSQFSDIFSEFDKYIAPAYHHDRCERSVQMRLYSMHKREFVLVFVLFFACLSLMMFIGLAGPPITEATRFDGAALLPKLNNGTSVNQKQLATGPFIMKTPKLSTYNQQVWIIATLETENTDGETIDKEFQICVTVSGLTEEHKPTSVSPHYEHHNRTRHLHCNKQICDEFLVMHLGYLAYTHYIVNFHFYDLEAFHERYHIKELNFHFKTYNPSFTAIEIWFRLIFVLGSFGATWWFYQTLRKYPVHCWAFEQKWLGILLPLLTAFDNPMFPTIFLVGSWLPGMIDAIFQVTFMGTLFVFWLCIYHGLRQNKRNIYTFYLPKFFVVAMMYFPILVISVWQEIDELNDPAYDHTLENDYYVVIAFLYIFSTIYFMYLFWLMVKAYADLRSMPFFSLRLKFLTLLMLIVLTIGAIISLYNFGLDILVDSLATDIDTKYTSSSQFMCFYGLLNLYVYVMAYVYSPLSQNPHDETITKDNPTFSMINDSDEDVIYGSDEESRRPLNRGHNDDDSD
ncbi:hypothetical protein ABEB36_012065 [Hypothenemus hampei]|uniref:Transmembrane protein 181 n=1 Tax=Hypothenemus hampei TaxID=57062 RepID=A0ABD1E9Y7_HYPHA